MSAPAKPLDVGGMGTTLSVEDAVAVARGLLVELDCAACDRMKKASPPPKSFAPEPAPAASGAAGALLDAAATRGTLLLRLASLLAGNSGARVQVAQYLAALINSSVTPALPAASDAKALAALADACHGVGAVLEGGALREALSAAGIEAPGLSANERAVLEAGPYASAAVAMLLQYDLTQAICPTAITVAAVSCEALKADTRGFASELLEGGHASASAVGDDLRALLEGSGLVDPRKGGAGCPPAVAGLPALAGGLMDATTRLLAALRPDMATPAAPPAKDGTAQWTGCANLQDAATSVAAAALLATQATVERAGLAAKALPTAAPAGPPGGAERADASALATSLGEIAANGNAAIEAGFKCLSNIQATRASAAPGAGALAAAAAATAAVAGLQKATALEALLAVLCLRRTAGVAAPPPTEGTEAAPAEDSGKDKKKDKKKKKGGGFELGKGSVLAVPFLEAAAAEAAPTDLATSFGALSLEAAVPDPTSVSGLLQGIAAVLEPTNPELLSKLADIRAVKEANQARRKPKQAKGTRDFLPDQMTIRERAFKKITDVFKRHGAVGIDTPVFELRETLMGKYGEDSKLIYDLADQGGEILSLRYDLTVPFARYVAMHGVGNIKRYHIAKVYRRDQPQMSRGRFREFFQCDFDIAGAYAKMVPDAEVLKVLVEILGDLQLGDYEIKLNHRALLDSMMLIAGVPKQKLRAICSAVDKLDKEPWEVVRTEMVDLKGLAPEAADKLGEFVQLRGAPKELLATLTREDHVFMAHSEAAGALADLGLVFEFLEAMNALDHIVLDLSLARGLDYYTGLIYEAVLKGANVGSIAAGGRYDGLVGMYSGKDVPAVGVSIGIERVFNIMEAQMRERAKAAGTKIRETETQVFVASIGSGMQPKRMALASKLWAAGIKTEFGFKPNPKMGDQLNHVLDSGIPFMLVFGENELAAGTVNLKDVRGKTEEAVPVADVIPELTKRIAIAEAEGASLLGH